MFKGKRCQRSNNSSSKSKDIEPPEDPKHWSHNVQEASVSFDSDVDLLLIDGGAEHGELCWIASLPSKGQNMVHHGGSRFNIGDIFLEVENQSVVGFTSYDLASWLSITSKNGNVVSIRFVNPAYLTRDLRKYLTTRFRKHSLDHELQHTIRLNVYRRTVPCTTRQMREGEIDGVDYRFLTTDQFQLLEESGGLLESGTYSGNFYGTPLPPRQDEINLSDPPSPQRSSPRSDSHLGRNGEVETGMANLKLPSGHVSGLNGDEDDDENALPPGWEKVDSYPECGIFYVDHINKKTQFQRPQAKKSTRKIWSVNDLRGEFVTTCLVKGPKGLGFTIIGGDETNDLLQVKTIIHGGPAYLDQKLQKGDVLLSVNNKEVLGSSHKEIIRLFQAIPVGTLVPITVCRGYAMSFDPNDPNHKVITTMAVQPPSPQNPKMDLVQNLGQLPGTRRVVPGLSPSKKFMDFSGNEETPSLDGSQVSANSLEFRRPSPNLDTASNGIESIKINLVRGLDGFRFTLSDLPGGRGPTVGQRVRSILDRSRCSDLKEGDVIEKINDITVSRMSHLQVVEILKACPTGKETEFVILRGVPVPSRSSSVTPSTERSPQIMLKSDSRVIKPSWAGKGYPASTHGALPNQSQAVYQGVGRSKTPGPVLIRTTNISEESSNFINERHQVRNNFPAEDNFHVKSSGRPFLRDALHKGMSGVTPDFIPAYHFSDGTNGFVSSSSTSSRFLGRHPMAGLDRSSSASVTPVQISSLEADNIGEHHVFPVRIFRHAEGFGFKLGAGIEEGNPVVTVSHVLPGGAADSDGRVKVGDEVLSIDSVSTAGISYREAKDLLARASVRGAVDLELRRWIRDGSSPDCGRTIPNSSPLPSTLASNAHQWTRLQKPEIVLSQFPGLSSNCREVRLVKSDQQNFGFTIISTLAKSGSQICSIVEDGPASKSGQLNVDDLLVAINGVDVRSMTHEDIVALIRSSGNQVNLLVDTPPLSDRLSSLVVGDDSSEKQNPYQIQRLMYHVRDLEHGFGQHPTEDEDSRMEHNFPSWESKDLLTSDFNHSKIPTSKFHYVEIKKSSKGFGFTISGGREYGDVPLSILKITEGSPADQDGNLKVGDQIVEINGQNASGMAHPEAIKAVQSNPLKVALLVKRQA